MAPEVLPCYVVCDVSLSMSDHLDEVNAGLREFRGAVHADPSATASVRVGVVGFAAVATVLQPLRPAAELAELSASRPRTGSNFGPAFALLRTTIADDVRALEDHRLRVRRPVVFFASDGRPTDPATWPDAFAALADPAWPVRPTVVAYGLGAVDRGTLDRIGTFRVFLGQDGIRLGTALAVSLAARRADRG
ncbi:VWA domain-containing protein [Actinosynnema sp. NPDC053489]|uniref:vWA domain-containing protein n=1 Tax=Actinosynnema sp. NPDC053489 TaxID=3363916 RepID=UPI0037C80F51